MGNLNETRLKRAYAEACADNLMGDPDSAADTLAGFIEGALVGDSGENVRTEFEEEYPDQYAAFLEGQEGAILKTYICQPDDGREERVVVRAPNTGEASRKATLFFAELYDYYYFDSPVHVESIDLI